ncbi:hypothetical protein SAICODRAFT_27790 [Saitoella complicata NRRL Y-17804]|uniref:uncharacterized protein n=1 Tax=Saitoella complicata (strain BCRC 22490 / CBS 7301 / JCM 7358 / NBRC 10748 / NRRL Y-17804) TaxID=698492 RepID=UPI00086800C6|nr:uncharacterized protein SAICODRAFT_27790 [Saitoella complicata NRRL Y-17804]ODQ50084.1 hypothetical protein SAICODRAFT_27790 [Saitoella complicata NRRL Y-17804]
MSDDRPSISVSETSEPPSETTPTGTLSAPPLIPPPIKVTETSSPSLPSAASSNAGSLTDRHLRQITETSESESGYKSGSEGAGIGAGHHGSGARVGLLTRRTAPAAPTSVPTRSMIVETEPVPPPPRSAVLGSAATMGVKTKPSTDTIRPSATRVKKRMAHGHHNPPNSANTTKADIFAHKIASAISSSDEDEDFVYESQQQHQHHGQQHIPHPGVLARTPSLQSIVSSRTGISGRRSMKFTREPLDGDDYPFYDTNPNHSSRAAIMSDEGPIIPGAGPSSYHAHNHPRGPAYKPSYHSLRLPVSYFPSSRPHSPRQRMFSQGSRRVTGLTDAATSGWSAYDGEDGDDEQNPLLSSSRRRYAASQRYLKRTRSTLVGLCVGLVVLAICLVGATVVTTRELRNVAITGIVSVLVSEDELMMDLVVEGTNRNLVGLSVLDVDLALFAKSAYVSDDLYEREEERAAFLGWPWDPDPGHHDHGTDPMPPEDSETMLLGSCTTLDTALTFDPLLLVTRNTSKTTTSISTLHLSDPGGLGNSTRRESDEEKSEKEKERKGRWERVIKHPFELVVRGVLKYEVPGPLGLVGWPWGGSAGEKRGRGVRTVAVKRSVRVDPLRNEIERY